MIVGREFSHLYDGIGFQLEVEVDAELEFFVGSNDEPGYQDFSFSVEYPEGIMVSMDLRKEIDKEIAERISFEFREMLRGDY